MPFPPRGFGLRAACRGGRRGAGAAYDQVYLGDRIGSGMHGRQRERTVDDIVEFAAVVGIAEVAARVGITDLERSNVIGDAREAEVAAGVGMCGETRTDDGDQRVDNGSVAGGIVFDRTGDGHIVRARSRAGARAAVSAATAASGERQSH